MRIPGTDVVTSPLGLGCAELFRAPSATQRRRVLTAAFDAGIRHFDVAPMYGLGVAEGELGRFAQTRRDDLTIATKFGIAASPVAQAVARVQGPLRRVLAASPSLRGAARTSAAGPSSGAAGSLLYRAVGYDATAARASLERSLRRLRTDHLDLLLLHDPAPGDARFEDVCAYLEQARTAGTIRSWGVAGEPEPTLAVALQLPTAPPVLQLRSTLLEEPPTDLTSFPAAGRIVFGVLGEPLARITEHVGGDDGRARRWHEQSGVDCRDRGEVAAMLLRAAHLAHPGGVVLFGTIDAGHAAAAVVAVTQAGGGDVGAFTRLVRGELGAGAMVG